MDFVILKVNGQDVSNVAHEAMVRAFEFAHEPIVVEVVRRRADGTSAVAAVAGAAAAASLPRLAGPAGHPELKQELEELTSPRAAGRERPAVSTTTSSVATQTEEVQCVAKDSMSAARPVRPGLPSPPPLTAYEWPQLELPAMPGAMEDGGTSTDDDNDKAQAPEGDDGSSAAVNLEQEDSTELLYLSITLRRQTISDRVGLTLCYGPADPQTGWTDVFIGEVEPNGIAGQDGILKEGDQVLQINGEDVHSRESAVRLFSASTKCISLLVCRSQSQWAEDDGFAEDPAEVFVDSRYPATNDLRAVTTATVKDCRQGNSCDFAVASPAQPRDSGQDTLFDIGQYRALLGDDCFGTEACLSTCGEEDEEEDLDAAQLGRGGHEISEEHCRRFLQALQLKCDAMHVQPEAAPATAAPASPSSSCSSASPQLAARQPKPRLGTVPLAPASAAAGSTVATQQHSACDKRMQRRTADDSSCHDTAYNTAESCRSSSIAAHESPSQPLYGCGSSSSAGGCNSLGRSSNSLGRSSAGGGSPRLHADRCRASRSPPVHDEARARADGFAAGKLDRCTTAAAPTAAAAAAGPSGPGQPTAAAAAELSATTKGGSSRGVAYTDRLNLAKVMAMQQQRLLEERLASAVTSCGNAGKRQPSSAGCCSALRLAGKAAAAAASSAPGAAATQGTATTTIKVAPETGTREAGSSSAGGQPVEWVVKVRSDGSRYIARRPAAARTRLLKDRQRRVEDERCGLTTDDDAASELKLGRRWSQSERRRHLESAREHRRRKELMRLAAAQRQRDTAAGSSAGEGGRCSAATAADLLELSQRKQLRQQLADIDFTTVQELLVHGSRSGAASLAGKVLLSVTTV